MPAANATQCANEQGAFWKMHDIVFENNKKLSSADLESYADQIGLNMDVWKKCFESKKYQYQIENDQKTSVALGARGTPAFFVNGRYISGAQPFEKFKVLIDEELKKAKASGIPRASYYKQAIVAKGKKKL
jgi:protein-disulfide isomerase